MDSFELNKILGAILGTLLFVMGVGFLAEAIYQPARSAGPGFDLPAAPAEGGPADQNAGPAAVADIGTLLAKADPKAGEAAAKKCQACHDFTEGGPNKTGPNLYDVVERPIASHPGFSYSAALQAKVPGTWTYADLNQWLISPKTFAPGTKMTYAGDKDDTDRANLIAYLSTLSKSPKPFPAPAAPTTGASSEAAPAAPSSEAAPAPASSSEAPAASAPASSEAPAPASSEAPAASSTPASSEAASASSSAAQ
jgi:cytochrome c